MKRSLLCLSLLASLAPYTLKADQPDYCAAIRGNGEGMPAHWGAMSAVVQEKGMPRAMAGGSSASITIFLLESLSLNTIAKTNTEKALLIKSFQGYFETLTQTPEGKAIAALLADKKLFIEFANKARDLEQLDLSPEAHPELMRLLQKHLSSLQTLAQSEDFKGLLNPEFLSYLQNTLLMTKSLEQGENQFTPAQVSYRKNQIAKAIQNFGKFDAATDETLFLRPGLISFVQLAKVMGQMGDFYAGIKLTNNELQQRVDADLQQFLKVCAAQSEQLSWRELVGQRPFCRQLMGRAILTYREGAIAQKSQGVRIHQKISQHLATFPTTSVLTGKAVKDFRVLRSEYLVNEKNSFGEDFRVSQKDLRFGYWGNEEQLAKIGQKLKSQKLTRHDEKSKKFLSLGDATWLQALSASPAEPGLSSLVDLDSQRISAGGWNDLHPTLVLKAHGCQDIVYITRKGGESMFAQGVIKKLTNLEGFDFAEWLGLSAEERVEKNALGNAADLGDNASFWSKLYNMANPLSSLRLSMNAATTIVCSDWDRYDARVDMNALVEDAFRAPWLNMKTDICR